MGFRGDDLQVLGWCVVLKADGLQLDGTIHCLDSPLSSGGNSQDKGTLKT